MHGGAKKRKEDVRRSSDLNGVQKHQQNGLLEGDDNATAEHLRSLTANDPARE